MSGKQTFTSIIISACPALLFFLAGMTSGGGLGFSLFIFLAIFTLCFLVCCLIILAFAANKEDYHITKDKNLFYHISGLGSDVKDTDSIVLKLNNDFLEINNVKLKAFHADEIIQTYKINAANILKADIVTKEELKNRSLFFRSAAGALLLGPTGAVLGGMTALNNKKIKTFFVISYLSGQGNIPQTIILNAGVVYWKGNNNRYITKLKKELATIPKSQQAKEYLGIYNPIQNEDGSIQL